MLPVPYSGSRIWMELEVVVLVIFVIKTGGDLVYMKYPLLLECLTVCTSSSHGQGTDGEVLEQHELSPGAVVWS